MLFAIYFDADEVLVHVGGRVFVFEAFPFHNVAPVTGCIAYRDDYGFVLLLCSLECFIAPRVPIHGVVGMLQEIGTLFVYEAIWHELRTIMCKGGHGWDWHLSHSTFRDQYNW